MPAAADVKYIHIGAPRYIDRKDPKWCEWIQNEMHEFRSIRQASGIPCPRNRRLITLAFMSKKFPLMTTRCHPYNRS